MRLAQGVVIVAHVHDGVLAAAVGIGEGVLCVKRGVGMYPNARLPEDVLSLIAEGASGEESSQVLLFGGPSGPFAGKPFPFLRRQRGTGRRWLAARLGNGEANRVVNHAGRLESGPRSLRLKVRAQETADNRLLARLEARHKALQRPAARRFGNHRDHLRARVCLKRIQRGKGGQPPDLIRKVMAACADGVGDAPSCVVYLGGEFLQSRAGRADGSDGALPDDVRESNSHPADEAGAAIRTHDEQPLFHGESLERQFVVNGNVAAEYEEMQAGGKGLVRLAGNVLPGDRQHRQIGRGFLRQPFLKGVQP